MIDLDAMRSSTARLHRVFGGDTRAVQTIDEVLELLNRLTQAEKDAARWRKLADSPDSSLTLRIHNSRCDQRDKVIDEAMK